MNILVTGGAGYIGSHAVRALREKGHGALVVDDAIQFAADGAEAAASAVKAMKKVAAVL